MSLLPSLQGLVPVIGTEIEFYLHDADKIFASDSEILEAIAQYAHNAHVPLYSLEKERGANQFEVSLPHTSDIAGIIDATERFKKIVKSEFLRKNVVADFSAKPLAHDYGSGLHIHVHLEDDSKNVFYRQDNIFSPYLLHSIAGLLTTMNASLTVFAPHEASYMRFIKGFNAPTTISWGPNNRTVAIRLPDKPLNNKHLEHRVAGADADVCAVIQAILKGMEHGITHKLTPPEPVYGDASLAQYKCPPLAISRAEAKQYVG